MFGLLSKKVQRDLFIKKMAHGKFTKTRKSPAIEYFEKQRPSKAGFFKELGESTIQAIARRGETHSKTNPSFTSSAAFSLPRPASAEDWKLCASKLLIFQSETSRHVYGVKKKK